MEKGKNKMQQKKKQEEKNKNKKNNINTKRPIIIWSFKLMGNIISMTLVTRAFIEKLPPANSTKNSAI
jgi:hypothetical protein